MGFKCAIVGLPNVGKSTLFNALTKAGVASENYPFCTIEPNVGVVALNDSRLEQIAQIVTPEKIIPTTVEFVDIAGLVKGASQGEGLGNKFLANIAQTDAILHLVRCFENKDITHVSGKISAIEDAEIINTELVLADIDLAEKIYQKAIKNSKAGKKEGLPMKMFMEKVLATLEQGSPLRSINFAEEELKLLKGLQFLTNKPMLYVANTNDKDLEINSQLNSLKELAAKEGFQLVSICADIEAEIADLEEQDKKEFLQEMGRDQSGLDILIAAGYKLLGLQTYFTAGPKEVKAWTINIGDNALTAAGKIHNDFKKGFIRAEIISFNDFIDNKGEKGAKDAGKLRSEGKEYIVQDADVIHFLFNV